MIEKYEEWDVKLVINVRYYWYGYWIMKDNLSTDVIENKNKNKKQNHFKPKYKRNIKTKNELTQNNSSHH